MGGLNAALVHVCTRTDILRAALRLVLWAWFPLSLVVTATLMAGHWVTLPHPERNDAQLSAALVGLREPGTGNGWLAVHVLYAQCRCSQRIVDHLVQRPHPAGVQESLLLAGKDAALAARLRRAGYRVHELEPAELATRYHVSAAPLLVVVDPAGTVRYLGGYTSHKQGGDLQDVRIIEALTGDRSVSELPLFGCAVSKQLQAFLDPLRLKYATTFQ